MTRQMALDLIGLLVRKVNDGRYKNRWLMIKEIANLGCNGKVKI